MDNQSLPPTPPTVAVLEQPPTIPDTPKPKINLLLLFAILIIASIIGAGSYYLGKTSNKQNPQPTPSQPKGCTLEAKICPDGSSVSRTGPNCEYAPCPQITTPPTPDPTANWKSYTNNKYGYTFQYAPDENLKLFGCSMKNPGEKGEETVAFDKINSAFPECAFGGYAWPISISIESSQLQCSAGLGYTKSQSEIKVAGITATKCIQKFTGFPDKNPEYIKGPDDIIDIFLANKEKYYRFTLTNLKYIQTFDQILSTFKFLN